jgi:hypothetical protein
MDTEKLFEMKKDLQRWLQKFEVGLKTIHSGLDADDLWCNQAGREVKQTTKTEIEVSRTGIRQRRRRRAATCIDVAAESVRALKIDTEMHIREIREAVQEARDREQTRLLIQYSDHHFAQP